SPLFAALGLIALLGWLLVAAGISEAVGLFGARHVPHCWLQAVSAVLAVAGGWGLIARPEAGLLATALARGVFLTVQGIGRVVFGLMLRPMEDWGWLVASGVLGVVLGVLLAANLGAASEWLIGLLLGLHLLATGGAMGWMAWKLRQRAAGHHA